MVAFLNATPDQDFCGIDQSRLALSQTFYPEFQFFERKGINITPLPENGWAAAHVMCHRSKTATRALIYDAIAGVDSQGTILVEGDKTDGIDGVLRDIRKIGVEAQATSKAHGKLLSFTRPGDISAFEDWARTPRQMVEGFWTIDGVFSADRIDPGSALLIQSMPGLSGRIADFGAGWGFLAHHVLGSPDVTHIDLIEADYLALEAAKRNAADPRAEYHWADVTGFESDPYDAIITNPPFHTSRKADPEIGKRFLQAAARLLTPKGQLLLVANRDLPYERVLEENFHLIESIAETERYKVIRAQRPIQVSKRR